MNATCRRPNLAFGITLCFVAGCPLLLPETKGKPLPATLADLQAMDRADDEAAARKKRDAEPQQQQQQQQQQKA